MDNTTVQTQTRSYAVDLIKVCAIFCVLFIHSSSPAFSCEIGSFDFASGVFWGSISRAGVPLFFMCSGALMLDPHKELSLKKLYTRSIPRLFVAMIVWSLFYKNAGMLIKGNLTLSGFWQSIKEVLLFKQEFHMYYLHIILINYAFLPVTRLFVRHASRKDLRYLLLLWFIFAILYPTVKPYWPFSLLSGIPDQWLINMTYASIGYGILGWYLKNYRLRLPTSLICLISGGIFVFLSTYVLSLKHGYLYANFLEGMSVGVCVLAIGLYGTLYTIGQKLKEGRYLTKVIVHISKASFCIFLVHVFFIHLFESLGINAVSFAPVLCIPCMVLLYYLCSDAVYCIISKIPILNRWII